jgi:hypothetical protein
VGRLGHVTSLQSERSDDHASNSSQASEADILQRQRYSRYLPVYEQLKPNRRKSVSKEAEGKVGRDKEREKLLKAQADSITKRRSTMNSRAAYDEDEALKKALEESRGDNGATSEEPSTRNGKRNRDESEEYVYSLQMVDLCRSDG